MVSSLISEVYDIPKYILKKAYEDILPNSILYRKKVGFPIPLGTLMGQDIAEYARELLLSKRARDRGIYNVDNIKKYLDNGFIKRNDSNSIKIWMLINLELFNRKYFDNNIL